MVRIHRRTGLNDLDNHDGVVTHLEPDILEYEVKWALRSITTNKTSGSDGVPAKLFKTLKDDSVKVLYLVSQFSCSVVSDSVPPKDCSTPGFSNSCPSYW